MASNTGSPRLEIEISAITTGLKKGLEDARKELKNFNDEVKRGASSGLKDAIESERLALTQSKTATQEAKKEAVNFAKELNGSLAESLNNVKKRTEELRGVTESFKQSTQASAKAVQDNKAQLESAREATEKERLETQKVRTEIAKLALARKQDSQAVTAGAGSIVEMRKRLSELRGIYDRLSESARNSTRVQSNLVPEIQRINNAVSKAEQSTGRFQRNVGNYGSALGNATGVTMEFSRIIQDAPFGMMGIGNNIQQLAANWQIYTSSAKQAAAASGQVLTTSGLLRGVLSSMISPANLLTLGIAAVTSGWVLFEKWQQKSKKSSEELAKQQKSFADQLKEYISTLDAVTQARLNGQKSANSEIVTINSLKRVIEDETLSRDARLSAIKQLKSEYPSYFKNISNEILLAGNAESAYKRLTTEILNSAKARAAQQKIVEEADKILDISERRFQRGREINKLESENLGLLKEMSKEGLKQITLTEGQYKATKAVQDYLIDTTNESEKAQQQEALNRARINELRKQGIEDSKQEINSVQTIDRLQSNITNSLENGGKLIGGVGESVSKIKDNTKEIASLTNGVLRDSLSYYDAKLFDIQQKYNEIYRTISDPKVLALARVNEEAEKTRVSIEKALDTVKEFIGVTGGRGISLSGSLTTPSTLPGLERAQERLNRPITSNLTDDFSKQFTSTLRRGLSNTFNDLFSDISKLSESNYEIEKKYADLRANATEEQIAGLNRMQAIERKINNGLTNMLSKVGGTFTGIAGNMLSSALSTGISSGDFSDLTEMFKGNKKAVGYGAAASLLGGALGSVFKPSDKVGQSLSGLLSGAGTGVAIGSMIGGPLGTILGGVGGALIGGISSLFGASKRKREEELAELQLAEQKKLVALAERQQALAYSSSIIGQMTNQGYVSSVDRDAYGNIVTRINGKDIELVLGRTKSGRG